MLRRLLLVAVLLALAGFGAQHSSGASGKRNGRIAFEHIGETSSGAVIYSMTAHGTNRRLLTAKQSSRTPAYSPRGNRIVFVGGYRQDDLRTMRSDGSHQRGLTHTKRVDETDPGWSPDGKQIVFAVTRPAPLRGIWVIGSDGRHRWQLTRGADDNPSWSPDGTEIAFDRSDPTQTTGIFVVPAGGGTPTRLSGPSQPGGISDWGPDWSPDGSLILFASDRPDTFRSDLWTMDPGGGDARQVTNTEQLDEHDAVWSPDGRWIAYTAEGKGGASSYQLYVSRPNGSSRRVITHACGDCAIINDYATWQPLPG